MWRGARTMARSRPSGGCKSPPPVAFPSGERPKSPSAFGGLYRWSLPLVSLDPYVRYPETPKCLFFGACWPFLGVWVSLFLGVWVSFCFLFLGGVQPRLYSAAADTGSKDSPSSFRTPMSAPAFSVAESYS